MNAMLSDVQEKIRVLSASMPDLISPEISQAENRPEYNRQYVTLNRTRVSVQRKINQLKNPEIKKSIQRRYYYKHLTAIRAKNVLYWKKNPERRRINWQRYYQANKEKCLENARSYVARNSERVKLRTKAYRQLPKYKAAQNERIARRRALKADNSKNDIQILNRLYQAVREKLHVRCYYCAKVIAGKDAHIDHVFPISKGGKHSTDNLCVACPDCNHSKHARHPNEWRKINQLILL